MIIALIVWLLNRFVPANSKSKFTVTPLKERMMLYLKAKNLLTLLLLSTIANSQQSTRIYSVFYKGDDVGTVKLHEYNHGDTVHYKIVSDIQARFIFRVCVKSVEESTFKNDRLIYSTVNRTVNGNQKVNRFTRAGNKIYTCSKEGKEAIINNESISYNVMKLYTAEPVNIRSLYSDNHQQFLSIKKTAEHTYKLELPDGNYNLYTYQNGICTIVEVFSTMYDMKMILKS